MCIALITTAHPDYPFILLSNRDEYLNRPTAPAAWWDPPDSHVLGGRDLQRDVHGTWLGITRQGRIAVLTNFREEGDAVVEGAKSRGAIVNSFLKTPPDSQETPEQFAQRLVDDNEVRGVGGFSLLFGQLRSPEKADKRGLAIISNRTPDVEGLVWLAGQPGETHGLSNSHYGDNTWPKVVEGEKLLDKAVEQSVDQKEGKDAFIERLFSVLSVENLRQRETGEDWDIYLRQLRTSIFIPPIGGDQLVGKPADEIAAAESCEHVQPINGVYGTQKQSVVLVSQDGKVTFVERTLFDNGRIPVPRGHGGRRFEFGIEGW